MKRADEEPTPEAIDTAIFQDPLRRHGEVERFLQMLLAVEPPYTILVNAPWGSGKTIFYKTDRKGPTNGKSGARAGCRKT